MIFLSMYLIYYWKYWVYQVWYTNYWLELLLLIPLLMRMKLKLNFYRKCLVFLITVDIHFYHEKWIILDQKREKLINVLKFSNPYIIISKYKLIISWRWYLFILNIAVRYSPCYDLKTSSDSWLKIKKAQKCSIIQKFIP